MELKYFKLSLFRWEARMLFRFLSTADSFALFTRIMLVFHLPIRDLFKFLVHIFNLLSSKLKYYLNLFNLCDLTSCLSVFFILILMWFIVSALSQNLEDRVFKTLLFLNIELKIFKFDTEISVFRIRTFSLIILHLVKKKVDFVSVFIFWTLSSRKAIQISDMLLSSFLTVWTAIFTSFRSVNPILKYYLFNFWASKKSVSLFFIVTLISFNSVILCW